MSGGADRSSPRVPTMVVGLRDLDATIVAGLARVPTNVTRVVAPPGGDMTASTLVALYRQARLAAQPGRAGGAGARMAAAGVDQDDRRGRTLLLYGVCASSPSPDLRDQLADLHPSGAPPLIGAVFATSELAGELDLVLRTPTAPLVASWELPTSDRLVHAAVTLEGVLAGRPRARGSAAALHRPVLRPSVPVGLVVSEGPGRARDRTAAWLRAHRIAYHRLEMLGRHVSPRGLAAAKALLYRRHGVDIVVDSDLRSARLTAAVADRPVLSFVAQRTVVPGRGGRCR